LRKGVKFHDGSSFTAEVAKWNIERLRDHPQSRAKAFLLDVDTVEAVDAATLRVRLKTPSGSLPFRVSTANYARVSMSSKAAFEKLGEAGIARVPNGTGPMRFKQWITDDRLILERNPDYWGSGADGKPLPYVDSFVSRYIPDLTVAVPDLQAGQLMAAENMPVNQLSVLQANPRLRVIEWPWAPTTYFQVGFNIYKPPFVNLKVRQAALHGIDRVGMAKALGFGHAQPAYYPDWTPSLTGYDDHVVKYPYDPGKVKQLLHEAGFPNGVETDLLVIQREPEATIGQFAAEMWTKVGIKTTFRALERLTWVNAVRGMNFQACFWRNTPPQADPAQIVAALAPDSSDNWSGFKDEQLAALMRKADATLEPKARAGLYRQALTRLQERAYLGTGYNIPANYVVNTRLHGLMAEFAIPNFQEVWLSK
jgi:ABC-type transport system substrate-binding protein